jgi:hypothetical protein
LLEDEPPVKSLREEPLSHDGTGKLQEPEESCFSNTGGEGVGGYVWSNDEEDNRDECFDGEAASTALDSPVPSWEVLS